MKLNKSMNIHIIITTNNDNYSCTNKSYTMLLFYYYNLYIKTNIKVYKQYSRYNSNCEIKVSKEFLNGNKHLIINLNKNELRKLKNKLKLL